MASLRNDQNDFRRHAGKNALYSPSPVKKVIIVIIIGYPSSLCDVAVCRRRPLLVRTLEVLPDNEILNAFLDERDFWLEAPDKLVEDLADELRVAELLSGPGSC